MEPALTAWTNRVASGPDLFALFWVAPEHADALRAGVRALALPHFERFEFEDRDEYVDATNADAWRHNLASPASATNLWIYHRIEVRGGCVLIERGYGGRSDPAILASEMRLIAWLIAPPDGVALAAWEFAAGGQGYARQVAHRAHGAAALRAFLTD